MYKILVVEDDKTISNLIVSNLSNWGYNVKGIDNFNSVLDEFKLFNPDLVLMDIYLPFYNGYHYTQEIRKISNVPIIFISSASDNMNIVMAMNIGADDFISKPFDINVLIAKVKAILRRTYEAKGEVHIIEYNGVVLNTNDASILYNDKKIELTKNDYRIMYTLFEKSGNIVSREEIMHKLWETDEFIDDNTLTVNIARLRKKLEDNGLSDFIKTKKGLGYYI